MRQISFIPMIKVPDNVTYKEFQGANIKEIKCENPVYKMKYREFCDSLNTSLNQTVRENGFKLS